MKRIERVRLYPTTTQILSMHFMLDVTRELYNALLQQRRDAYGLRKIRVTAKMQYAELTALRFEDRRIRSIYRECQDAVLHRLELAMRAFFRRCKRGETPGFPRYKPRSRWSQLVFPHGNRALKLSADQRRARVPGVGTISLRKGRVVPKDFGRAWIVERNARWYLCLEHEVEAGPQRAQDRIVGIDRGAHVLAATSDGKLIRNAAVGEKRKTATARLQRELEARTQRDARGLVLNRRDRGRAAAALRLARAKEREANARRDYAHKVARQIVDGADAIGIEALNLRAMTRSAKGTVLAPGRNVRAKAGLNRVVLDAGFGLLRQMIESKAEKAGVMVVAVEARFSSQCCSRCGHCERGNRRRRRFACRRCGFTVHADINAALEIRRRAQWVLSSSPNPAEEAGRRNHDVVA